MVRNLLPWIALAFGAGAFVGAAFLGSGSGSDPGLADEVAALRQELAAHLTSNRPDAEATADHGEFAGLLDAARTATRHNAETATEDLVRAANGEVMGKVADTVLHLLREGTGIHRCFVMRGIADGGGRTLDPRVVRRCMEIARCVPIGHYDSHYFFAFLLPLVDPKPDELVEFVLERALQRSHSNHEYLDTLRGGLSEDQTARCARVVMDLTEQADNERLRSSLLQSLLWLALPEHVSRLESLAGNEELADHLRLLARQAAKNARGRQ